MEQILMWILVSEPYASIFQYCVLVALTAIYLNGIVRIREDTYVVSRKWLAIQECVASAIFLVIARMSVVIYAPAFDFSMENMVKSLIASLVDSTLYWSSFIVVGRLSRFRKGL